MLRCTKDDIARVVDSHPLYRWTIDKVVGCAALEYDSRGEPCWVIDNPIKRPDCFCGHHVVRRIPDKFLQPINGRGPLEEVEPVKHEKPLTA